MAWNEIQQLHKILEDSRQILLVFGKENNEDTIASTLALKIFLEKQSKHVDVVSENFVLPKKLKFLPEINTVKPELTHLQKLTIKVDVSKAKIETLSYDIKDDILSIHLNPKQGTITKNDLRTAQSNFKYDLIVVCGAKDLESLGEIFYNNTDLFYRTPIINIDQHTDNEHFGQINIIDVTSASIAEIIYKNLEQLGAEMIDQKIANLLLTGIISQTHGFKATQVTPHTLNLAGKLMGLGADREKIIQNLYRTHTIATLKLWGRALSNLQTDKKLGLVWTTITRDDFVRSSAVEEDLKNIVSELISDSPEAKIILLLNETYDRPAVRATLAVEKSYHALEILSPYPALGNKKTASVVLENNTLTEAEEKILTAIKNNLSIS